MHICVLVSSFVSVSDFQCFTALLSSLVLFLFFLFPNGRAINQREREGERGEEGGEGDTGGAPGEERLARCPEKEREREKEREKERASTRASQNERRREFKREKQAQIERDRGRKRHSG